jgi:hypothetical protein
MAQFNFWTSMEDRANILKGILALGDYKFVGNRNYQNREVTYFSQFDQKLIDNLSINKLLYIVGPFSTSAISMSEVRSGAYDGTYTVNPLRGGPLLTLSLPGCKAADDKIRLTPGDISYSPWYLNEVTGQSVPPSDELKQAYKQIIKEIKKHTLLRSRIRKWVGRDAWNLLAEDRAVILVSGKWLSKADLQIVSP